MLRCDNSFKLQGVVSALLLEFGLPALIANRAGTIIFKEDRLFVLSSEDRRIQFRALEELAPVGPSLCVRVQVSNVVASSETTANRAFL